MAVFIKRERLGSRPPPDRMRVPTSEFRGKGVKFGVMAEAFEKAREDFKDRLDQKKEDNAEVQRWRTQMTPEERSRDAIERMIPTAKAVQELRTGKECSHEDARKMAENIAYKSDRLKDGE